MFSAYRPTPRSSPVSVLEGWSVATPAVLSDIPTLEELAASSHGAITARREPGALADALVSLLADADAASALGRAGQDFWRTRYTLDAVAEWHVDHYRELNAGMPAKVAA